MAFNRKFKGLFLLLVLQLVCRVQNQTITVAIVATNDIHGSAFAIQMQRSDTGQRYSFGGLQYMGGLIRIIQQQYPNHLYLDAGDQFQGGIESGPLISKGKIMTQFYQALELNGSAIGNHQFDFGPEFLYPYMNDKQNPNIAANIKSEKGESVFMPKQKLSNLYITKDGIKIGVIGLTTIETPQTTDAFQKHKFPNFTFEKYSSIVIQQSKKLRSAGANAVIVLGHLGNHCNATNTYGIWRQNTQQIECLEGQVTQLLKSIPKGTIDAVIQGHVHNFVHHFIDGVPYLGTINGGSYFNVLYLTFKDNIIQDKSIQGPIPVCQKIFNKIKTCQYVQKDKLEQAGELVNWKFHNKNVKFHEKIKKLFEVEWQPLMKQYFYQIALNEIVLEKEKDRQCQLGNLITNLIHSEIPNSDIVIISPSSLRTTWYPGILQYQHIYNMIPFTDNLISFDVNGKELIDILRIIQSGQKGFYMTYGLKQIVTLSQNKTKKFISATLANNMPIRPNQSYRVVTIDFLVYSAGDDFKDVMGKVYTLRNNKTQGDYRQTISNGLKKLGNIEAGTLIDPRKPRLIVVPAQAWQQIIV